MNKGHRSYRFREKGMIWKEIAKKLDIKTSDPASCACGLAYNYSLREGKDWPINYPGKDCGY